MIWIGTSGYNYPEWKGSFYPKDLAAAKMLPYYAARFPTVEINYTFYRMPTEKLVAGWAAQTPSPCKLTLKAPRRITHDSRLKNCGDLVTRVLSASPATLGDKLGALLFQLPPNLKKDLALFDAFLADLPPQRAAPPSSSATSSWLDDEVFERLTARNLALCVADSEKLSTPVRITADYAYFRLRDEGYTPDDIARWADTIRARDRRRAATCSCTSSTRTKGKGPEFAAMLRERLGSATDKRVDKSPAQFQYAGACGGVCMPFAPRCSRGGQNVCELEASRLSHRIDHHCVLDRAGECARPGSLAGREPQGRRRSPRMWRRSSSEPARTATGPARWRRCRC